MQTYCCTQRVVFQSLHSLYRCCRHPLSSTPRACTCAQSNHSSAPFCLCLLCCLGCFLLLVLKFSLGGGPARHQHSDHNCKNEYVIEFELKFCVVCFSHWEGTMHEHRQRAHLTVWAQVLWKLDDHKGPKPSKC